LEVVDGQRRARRRVDAAAGDAGLQDAVVAEAQGHVVADCGAVGGGELVGEQIAEAALGAWGLPLYSVAQVILASTVN